MDQSGLIRVMGIVWEATTETWSGMMLAWPGMEGMEGCERALDCLGAGD